MLGLFFDPEVGGNNILRNFHSVSAGYKALYPRRQNSSTKHAVYKNPRYINQENVFGGNNIYLITIQK
jgi:hypothetical protein